MLKILVVEDDPAISNLINLSLSDSGYRCIQVYDGMDAANLLEEQLFDLILLDIMLPSLDGYELMEYIRTLGIPVIFLTAKSSTLDKVKGLKLGADDYLTKPFEIIELLARVETVLRRYHKVERALEVHDITIDTMARSVSQNGKPISLTKKEYEILMLFIQNSNIALLREVIYEKVWEAEFLGNSRTVDLHVQRLRKKLHWEDKITAVYKVGYRLEV